MNKIHRQNLESTSVHTLAGLSTSSQGNGTVNVTANDTLSILDDHRSSGRPTGTTLKRKKDNDKNLWSAKNYITQKFTDLKKENKLSNLPNGSLEKIIVEGKTKFNVTQEIPKKTIEYRYQKGIVNVDHLGAETPMKNIEKVLLQFALQKAAINQHLT